MKPQEIRNLSIEDYDSIIKLWERAGLPCKPKGRDSRLMMEKQMAAFPDLFIGAFYRGKLVGIVIGSCDGRMKGWVNRLAVDPEYRGKGLGQRLVSKVEKALEKIRPALQADGGNIELVDVTDGVVKVKLVGACGSCPMSQMTLKMGVEKALKQQVPEVKRVESV